MRNRAWSVLLSFAVLLLSNAASAAPSDDGADFIKVDAATDKALSQNEVKIDFESKLDQVIPVGLSSDSENYSPSMAVDKPECDNPRLMKKVLERIAEYYKSKPVNSLIEKRRQVLTLKNLNSFVEEDIDSFPEEKNFYLAGKLISYKINKGLKAEDMRLCRSVSYLPIYLLIYPHNAVYTVEIVNFPGQTVSERFTTVYD